MDDNQPTTDEIATAPAPLITIRGLGVLTALVGLILASSAATLRELNSSQLALIAIHVGAVAVSFGLFVIVYGARRRRLEKEAGPLLLALDKDWNQLLRAWDHGGLLLFGVILANMGVQSLTEDLQSLSGATSIDMLHWQSTLPIFCGVTFLSCIGLWDFDLLQLRKNGAILGLNYTPWEKLKTCRWSAFQENTLLVGWGKIYTFPVDPQDRPKLESILEEVSAKKSTPKKRQA